MEDERKGNRIKWEGERGHEVDGRVQHGVGSRMVKYLIKFVGYV